MNGEQKFKILIADDDRANIIALACVLKPKYDILVAKDGRTAIEVVRESSPDLILLDIVMPDMTGFEVLAELKSSDVSRNIPVIFVTGRDNTADEETGFFLGAVDYIKKPFNSAIVAARIKTHLQMVEYIRKIERLGMIDVLTDLPNRRSFDSQLSLEWKRAIREKTPISILMIDIDNFKMYNDTYGHPQGDVLLQAVSAIFAKIKKRPADFVSRWGGEEFAVLLPNTNMAGALAVAEQMRAGVEGAVVSCADGTGTSVTISIGVSSETPSMESSISLFVSNADKALYTAKSMGKNKVCS